jgi:hypothetical protein
MTSLSKLQITSTLFGTVVLHSYIKRDFILHFLCLNVTILSVLNHSIENEIVHKIDKIFAHILAIYANINLLISLNLFFLSSLLVIIIWRLEQQTKNKEKAINLHVLIHITAVMGMHGYLLTS